MRRLLRLMAGFALSLCAGLAAAQAACRVLDPELAGTYQGGCKDGLAEGMGEARGSAEYRGEFRAGRKHGKGVKSWSSGDRYEGDFVEDKKEGFGTYTWSARGSSAGERYVGAYRADRRHGFGTYTWPTGDVYAGPWADDEVIGVPTGRMLDRARIAKEAEVVLAQGVKVCRQLTAGISEREWIRGTIVEASSGQIGVRVDDAGRLSHTLNGVELRNGTLIRDSMSAWTPCL